MRSMHRASQKTSVAYQNNFWIGSIVPRSTHHNRRADETVDFVVLFAKLASRTKKGELNESSGNTRGSWSSGTRRFGRRACRAGKRAAPESRRNRILRPWRRQNAYRQLFQSARQRPQNLRRA